MPGVNRDIPRVKAALEKNGFQVDVVMNPANKDALDKAFSDLIFTYGNSRDNRLLFYYAGHGYTIKTDWGGELGYIVPANTPLSSKSNPTAFQSKAMEMAQIDIYAKRIQSKHAIFLFDACFAGTIFTEDRSGVPEYISYNTTKPVRQFITSGSANEVVADESSFCDQFIKALDGKADYDKDGYLTGSELGSFLKKEVSTYSNNRQHPQSGKINDSRLDEGDFVFVINTPVSPGAIPAPIQPAKKQVVIEEAQITGAIQLSTELSGSLYLDGDFARSVNANNRYTLNNLTVGKHTLKITGDETWEGTVTVEPNGLGKVDAFTNDDVSYDASSMDGNSCMIWTARSLNALPGKPTMRDYADLHQPNGINVKYYYTTSNIKTNENPAQGSDLHGLIDGMFRLLPNDSINDVFFEDGESRIWMDLQNNIVIDSIHIFANLNTQRGTQLFCLWGSDSDRPPNVQGDPKDSGWTSIMKIPSPKVKENYKALYTILPKKGKPWRYLMWITNSSKHGPYYFKEIDVFGKLE